MIYYTYAYLREDRTPYYIGKGKGNRAYRRSKDRTIKPPKDKSRILILKQNLTEEEAFKHEIYMIAVFGRKDLGTGILHNRTDGGEGTSGRIHNEETKRKIREARKGKIPWNKGKPHSEETRKKLSKVQIGRIHSEETKQKMSEIRKNPSEETRRKISEAQKGKKWWNNGKINKKVVECPGAGWVPGRKNNIDVSLKELAQDPPHFPQSAL